ncbi:AI-2E family transporter [Mumia sp. zg.B53]|uniref:AI-2E family transporter n=1 Tax=unclassified Mumia TaxID=2621872 RepID=UPI001C6E1EE1|nr:MULTISPECIES: AI-2E family transporter [unclassified Mumia]MBW9207071.1 AI-2E family transporter [Mumia sp. zg.B17]MBW9210593.1 AI-2E family transporter [Mumia sp. zg.B21]MBW9215206.1 AI-2E family transporter [Mumia sp. zg.B53]MDD9348254.1 AI-2E family transporter [Mumia sp.]
MTRDRSAVLASGYSTLARWSWQLIAIAIGLYILGWIVGKFWMIGYPVMLALIVTTLLGPPAAWLRGRGVPAAVAAVIVVLSFLAVLTGVVAVLAPQVAGQVGDIAAEGARGLQAIQDWVQDGPLGVTENQLDNAIESLQDKLRDSADVISAGALSTLGAATNVLVNTVLVLMLTFFFVKDGHKFLPWMRRTLGGRAGTHLSEAGSRAWDTLGGFIRTQALVSFVDAVFIGIGLVVLDVPLAVPLAVIVFFGGFIPIVGAFVTGALAVLVTLVTNDFRDAVIMLLVIVAVQQLEGNVLSPWLQGKAMDLQAAIVLLAITAGSSLFGITGAFLAVPAVATAAAVLRYVNEQIALRSGEPSDPPDDPGPGDATPGEPATGDPSPRDPGAEPTPA